MGEWSDWLASVGQVLRLGQAYRDEEPDDWPDRPSRALKGYVRCVRRTGDRSAIAVAVAQIRQLLDEDWSDPDTLELVDHLALPQPGGGRTRQDWLQAVADLLDETLEGASWPEESAPVTSYEWRTCYPDLAQVLGAAFHQDALAIHGSYEAALRDALDGVSRHRLGRAIGQAEEILYSGLDEATLTCGMRALGAGLEPPGAIARRVWLAALGGEFRTALGERDHDGRG